MHNYHTECFYFHANGDPIPGPVLIREMHNEDSDPFRTTCEEVITFCAAVAIDAAGDVLDLRTTGFVRLDGDNVLLTAHARVQPDDAMRIIVPLADLREFAGLVTARRAEYAFENLLSEPDNRNAAMIALFHSLFGVQKGRRCEWKDRACLSDCKGPAYCPHGAKL